MVKSIGIDRLESGRAMKKLVAGRVRGFFAGRPYGSAVVAAFLGVALSIGAYVSIAEFSRQVAAVNFTSPAQSELTVIQSGIGDYRDAVESLGSFIEASNDDFSLSQFTLFTDFLRKTFPGITALAWDQRVTRDQRAAFEAKARATIAPDYQIVDNATLGTPTRAGDRDEYFPSYFSTKEEGSARVLGYDAAFDPRFAPLYQRARDTGQPMAAGPLPLIRIGTETRWGYLVMVPIFRRDMPRGTIDERRVSLKGYAIGVVRVQDTLNDILGLLGPATNLDLYFFNAAGTVDNRLLYWKSSDDPDGTRPVPNESTLRAGPHWEGTLKVLDRDLGLLIAPSRPLIGGFYGSEALTRLAVGLVMTAMLVFYLFGMTRRALRLEAVTTRLQIASKDLGFSNVLLTAATENSPEGILVVDETNRQILSNQPYRDIWHVASNNDVSDDAASMHRYANGKVKNSEEFFARVEYLYANPQVASNEQFEFKDGRVIDRLTRSLFDSGKNYLGRIWFFRDVTERVRAEQALRRYNALLDAMTMSVATLLTKKSVAEAVPLALAYIGNAVEQFRILIIERLHGSDGRQRHRVDFEWSKADGPGHDVTAMLAEFSSDQPDMVAWYAPLAEGKTVVTTIETDNATAREILRRTGVQSLLFIPIFTDAIWWGYISLASDNRDQAGDQQETTLFQTLGNLIGAAIVREQRAQALSDAKRIVENSSTVLYRASPTPSKALIYISDNIARFGYEADPLIAAPEHYKSYVHPDDLSKVLASQIQAVGPDGHAGVVEYRFRTLSGSYRWIEDHYNPVRDAKGKLVEVEGLLVDVTEHKEAEQMISILARTDALTGLANRRTFLEKLDQAFAATRRGGKSFAVLSLDLDHFKEINDTLGHPVGDLLLRAVAERLKNIVRATDTVARFGGDEFMVLQTDMNEPEAAGALGEKIRGALALPYALNDNTLQITASIGIAIFSTELDNAEAMIAQADVALYRAKEEGRGRFRFHSDDMNAEVRARIAMTEDLRKALANNEMELRYQPMVELSTGRVLGMEALVRWNRPQHGMLLPDSFLPVVERIGMMVPLGHWVLREACRQMKIWHAAGITPSVMTVNLSLAELKTGDALIRDVAATLAEFGVEPASIEFDVTETMLAGLSGEQSGILEKLHGLGIQIALDDFGSELSALSYLSKYHVSHLKICRPFVQTATTDPRSAATIRALVGLAKDLSIGVIAEGVETNAQRALLMSIAPQTHAQGFLFSKPLTPDAAGDVLRRKVIGRPVALPVGAAVAIAAPVED